MSNTAKTVPEPEAPAGVASSPKIAYCSFCFKSQHDVRKLIAGPANIFICDECAELCNEWIAERPPPSQRTSEKECNCPGAQPSRP